MRARVKRFWTGMVTAACLMCAVAFPVSAAETVEVLEQRVTEDTVYLYLRDPGEAESAEAQIGAEAADSVTLTDGGSVPIVTWILLDNSISIGNADWIRSRDLLTNLAASGAENESFLLCTYDEHLHPLTEETRDYAALKKQIDALERSDQESYLTDVLAELLDQEAEREEQVYVRVVVICDGVDNNPGGLTREELNFRLAEESVPIYTFGCKRQNNESLLKELYSLSRQTGAKSWTLSELNDTLEAVQSLSGEELPILAEIRIPEKLRDGSERGIQLTFPSGRTASAQAMMPFGEMRQEPAPEPEPEPEPEVIPEPEPEPEPVSGGFPVWLLLVIGAAVLLAAVIVLVVVLLVSKKRKAARIVPVRDPLLEPAGGGGKTAILGEDDDSLDDGGRTMLLVENENRYTLSLTDTSDPTRHFEVPLRGRVSIGRGPSNQIVLDYDRSISSRHCEIFQDGKTFKLRDLHSSNGTFLNGLQVVDVVEISNGSTIKLGRAAFTVRIR